MSITFVVVTVTSDLKWNTHISNTCAKARQKLGFLYRFVHMADSACLTNLYKCLVLPTLGYCSVVWDPTAVALIDQLESIQRFAARLVTKRWSSTPDVASFPSSSPPMSLGTRLYQMMIYSAH